jgi:hypothetical protein
MWHVFFVSLLQERGRLFDHLEIPEGVLADSVGAGNSWHR